MSKFETNTKFKLPKSKTTTGAKRAFLFWKFGFWTFDIVSDFGFRASDFSPKNRVFDITLRCSAKHVISDRAGVFTGNVFAELLDSWNVKPRFGAVGKHGSISVTERVIKTLKYEWLKRVPIIKGFDHLTMLCEEFECWYNSWRPHMTLDGIRPDDVYYDKKPEKPKRDSKEVPCNIEHRLFRETRIIGYRLKNVA